MSFLETTTTKTNTLCLNMIVRNESRIIIRLLESVINIIDCYCICDTGSSDNTIEVIQNYFLGKKIPGKIVFEPFKDFSYNRNYALNSCIGMSDYVILLDADMILDVRNFNKNMFNNHDSFTILQGNDNFYYNNKRIVRNDGLYSYVGVTHEYINTPHNSRNYNFKKDELFIIDIGDGGSKSDKFERDIRLLLNGIEEEPNNERYHFYLANTYKDSGKFKEAVEYYEKRIKFGGWNQEVWQAMYKMGFCYKDMGNIQSAIYSWLNAYELIPERIENLYQIVKHYREISKHKLAHSFYNLALTELNKNYDRDGYLFLENDVYTYKLLYEYTIYAYYIGVRNINNELIKIFNIKNIDMNMLNNLLFNFKFYFDILKPINIQDFTNDTDINLNGEITKFKSSSSCLIANKEKDGYYLNIRYVNYYITESGSYINCDKHITTSNKFIELTKDFKPKMEKTFDLNYEDRRYIGIEDVKIFEDVETKQTIFTGTGFHKNNRIGMVYGNYDVNSDILHSNELTCAFNNADCEKNWTFVDYKSSTHMIYKWNPLQIGKLNEDKTTLNLVINKEMPNIFSHVRGSTCGFKYYKKLNIENGGNINIELCEEEIWFVVHLVSYENPRHYYHLFVVFDEDMNLLRYSAPFKFEGTPIEYCLSVVVEDQRVLVNYSCWDRTTKLAVYDKTYIDSMIKYT
jgi:tetratricopeptide (TPR) repeat protein